MAEAVAEEYRSSLCDLNFNSKPHINMLTMLAEENVKYAAVIVETIITHINSVPSDLKLPSLYLVDSIMKNIGGQYITLFSKHMITLFTSVFEKVEEATRSALYKLRQTWNEILPKNTLYGLDCNVNHIDPAWPITAKIPTPATIPTTKNAIHVNPKFMVGSPTQAVPSSPQNQGKPLATKKSEPILKEKEVLEIKKKQEEMLRLIEEKKVQLKALEQKKLEMAAKQRKKPMVGAPVVENQVVPKKPINHRDPRLKKNLASLQSVVVVPSPPVPQDSVANSNGDRQAKPDSKVKGEKPDPPTTNKTLIENKKTVTSPKTKTGILKEKHNANPGNFAKNFKFTKKLSVSPDKHKTNNMKKPIKQSLLKYKRTISQDDSSQVSSHGVPVTKKGKHELSQSKDSLSSNTSEQRLRENTLFGNEDKDYRHQLRQEERLPPKWHHPEPAPLQNSRIPHEVFEQRTPLSNDTPTSISSGLKMNVGGPDTHAVKNPMQMPCERNFPNVPMESSQVLKNNVNADRSCASNAISAPRERPPPPLSTNFILDGKSRTVHFVNNRALTFTDKNEPREVNFVGPPRNVYIEGLSHPIVVGFDGRPWEFEIDGKRNVIQFGNPSREIYVNNYPYEAQFGGPPITVVLEDKKDHRLKIDGPPPQVVISEKPAFELLEVLNRSRGLPQAKVDTSLKSNKVSESGALLQDVDMRLKPTSVPETVRDVDWRQMTSNDSSQGPWNPTSNSLENFTAMPLNRSYTTFMSSSSLDFNKGSVGMNSDINTAPMPHPGYRGVPQPSQRPPFDHINQNQQPPNTWEMKSVPALPPPPGLPPSLVLNPPPRPPNLSQMSRFNLPPPSQTAWKPLSPPPMFGGSVPEPMVQGNLPPSTTASAIVPNPEPVTSQPALPVSVETIYEKLVAAGFINKKPEPGPSKPVPEETKDEEVLGDEIYDDDVELEEIPEIRLTSKSLRNFNRAVIVALYKGSQCATCGMRFKEIQSEQYSRHLDWHFRMNRREKDGAKKAYSRRLYYEVKDWIEFKEIEEAAERTPSYFELQADGETLKNEEKEAIISVPASECESEKCSVCGEQFQLFWVEEEEEWHLKHAMRHEGEAYHPSCYEDFKKAAELAKKEEEERIAREKRDAEEKLKAEAEAKIKAEEEEAKLKAEEQKIKETEAKMEEDSADKVKTEIKEETNVSIKQEEALPPSDMEVDPSKETEITIKQEKVEGDPDTKVTEMEVDKEKEVSDNSKKKKVKVVFDEGTTNSESESEEEELRLPTPDPRFQVLPPTLKGTELSALCTIM